MQRWQENASPIGWPRTSRSNAAERPWKILGSEGQQEWQVWWWSHLLQSTCATSQGLQLEPKDLSIDIFASDFTKFCKQTCCPGSLRYRCYCLSPSQFRNGEIEAPSLCNTQTNFQRSCSQCAGSIRSNGVDSEPNNWHFSLKRTWKTQLPNAWNKLAQGCLKKQGEGEDGVAAQRWTGRNAEMKDSKAAWEGKRPSCRA